MSYQFNILFSLILLLTTLSREVFAIAGCEELLAKEISKSVVELKEKATVTEVVSEICGNRSAKNVDIFGTKAPNKRQYKEIKKLLCSKKGVKNVNRAKRFFKKWLSEDQKQNIRKCLKFENRGLKLATTHIEEENKFILLEAAVRKSKIRGKRIQIDPGSLLVSPESSFDCLGPLAAGNEELPFGSNRNLYAACSRNSENADDGAEITLQTSLGTLRYKFSAYTPYAPVDYSNIGEELEVEEPPRIRGCELQGERHNRVYACRAIRAMQECNAHVISGNIRDCIPLFQFRILGGGNTEEVEFPQVYTQTLTGTLTAGAQRSDRHMGFVSGAVDYTINFDTPELEPRPVRQCDPTCGGYDCPENLCVRSCVRASHHLETPTAGVNFWLRVDDVCEGPAEGTLELGDIDKYRAYNLCSALEAWGSNIEGVYYARVSKMYRMQDRRTTIYNSARRSGWRVTDDGQYIRKIVDLEIPIDIYCGDY